MNQFEADNLSIIASAWLIAAGTKGDDEAKGMRRCASELREWLQHCDTAPGPKLESGDDGGEPFPLPSMKNPDRLPTIEGA